MFRRAALEFTLPLTAVLPDGDTKGPVLLLLPTAGEAASPGPPYVLLPLPAELGMPALPAPLTMLFWAARAGPRAVLLSPGPLLLLVAAGVIEPAAVLAEELLVDASGPDTEEVEGEEDWALGLEEPSTPGARIGTPDMPADNFELIKSMAENLQRKQRQVCA